MAVVLPYNNGMIALAIALLAPAPVPAPPTFESLSGQFSSPFGGSKRNGTEELRIRFEAAGQQPAARITFRYSKGKGGTVFEGLRDGRRVLRVMNDGKTMAVQATESGMMCRVPANPKKPIDVAMMRLRPVGKGIDMVLLGQTNSDQLKGYKWKNTGDKPDIMDGVDCRHLSYVGNDTEGEGIEINVDCWMTKGKNEFKFVQFKFGEGIMSLGASYSATPLPMPAGALARATFPGLEPAPLSVVRERAGALWAPVKDAEENG